MTKPTTVHVFVVVGLGAICAISPWLFGSVQPRVQQWLFWALTAVMIPSLLWVSWRGPRSAKNAVPILVLPLFLAPVIGCVQLQPMNSGLLQTISPKAAEFWSLARTGDVGVSQSLSYPVSLFPASTRRDLALLGLPVGVFVLASLTLTNRTTQLLLLGIVALNGAALSLFGIIQQLTFNGMLFWTVPLRQGGEPFASFVNRNHAGGYLNMCVAASLAILVWSVTRRQPLDGLDPDDLDEAVQYGNVAQRWSAGWLAALDGTSLLVIALATISAAGVVCSLSRGAILSLVIAVCLTTPIAIKIRGAASIAGVAAIVLLVGIGLSFWLGRGELLQDRLTETVTDIEQQQNSRIDHWQDVLAVCRDFWRTGSGIGTYRYVYRPYESQVASGWFYHAENQYLESFVETGFFGFLLILLCIAIAFVTSLRLLGWRRDPFAFAIGIACLFAMSSQAVHAFFDFGLYMPSNAILLAALLGCCSACVPPADTSDGMWIVPPRWPSRLLHTGVCLAALAWVIWGGLETGQHAAIAGPMDTARDFRETEPQDVERISAAITDLERKLAETRSCDADARVSLAKLYVLHYRATAFERLVNDSQASSDDEKNVLWQMTSPLLLHRRAHQLQRSDEPGFRDLVQQPPVIDNLTSAISQLRMASCYCPVLGKAHVAMAQIGVAIPGAVDEELEVQTAIRLAPNDPDVLFRCGVLDLQAERKSAGIGKLKKCLSLSSKYLKEIEAFSRGLITDGELLDAMPDSPKRIVEIAKRVDSRWLKNQLADRAVSAIASFPLDPAEEAYLQGTISRLRNDYPAAIEQLLAAVKRTPERHAWRFELSKILVESGRLDEAYTHASTCVRQAPTIPAYRQLLKRVNSLRLSDR